MKLKNSYTLLIVMSLFLLIGIGSVCASDAAMDAGVGLADDGSVNAVSENSADVTILKDANQEKINTSVVSEDVKVNEGDDLKIPVTVNDNESKSIAITSKDLNVTENKKALTFNYANNSIILTDKLAVGNHSIDISYLGNENYTASSANILLSIVGEKYLNTTTSVNVNSTQKVLIPITLTDGVNVYEIDKNNLELVANYTEGNDTINKTINNFEFVNGVIAYTYDLNVSSCTLNIAYTEENKTYKNALTVNRIYNAKIETLNTVNEYQSGNFTFKVTDIDTNGPLVGKTLNLYTGSNIRALFNADTDANGIATFKTSQLYIFDQSNGTFAMKQLEVGKHEIELSMDSTAGLIAQTVKTNLTINKATINIVINPYKEVYQSDKKVTINVTNAKSGEGMSGVILHLNMPATTQKDYYFQTDADGISQINVTGLIPGDYKVTVSNNDTKNINEKTVSGTITILAVGAKFTVSIPGTVYYNSGTTATIKITDKNTGKAIPNAIVLVTVQTGSKKQSLLYQANDKGTISVNYAPAAVGSHKLIVEMADTRYSASKVTKSYTVKKASAVFNNNKVTTYYKSTSKNLIISLKNTKTSKLIYSANVNVKIYVSNNKYYNYNGQTASDGKLRISLKTFTPGTYKVVISSPDNKNYTASKKTTSFTIQKAPAKITASKVVAKKGENKYFSATIKNTKENKVISGVKISFKVYTGSSYKTYTAFTNAKGIAKISVSALAVGTHKVIVSSANQYVTATSVTSSIVINKK